MTSPRLFTTREIADFLGVADTAFVVGEIREGRLACARQFQRPGGRTFFRVSLEELRAYCEKHWPRLVEQLPSHTFHAKQ